jgi:hypothetical protein
MFGGDGFYNGLPEGLHQDTFPVTLIGPAGNVRRSFGEYPAAAIYHGPPGHRPPAIFPPPLAPLPSRGWGQRGVYVSQGERFEIARFDPQGTRTW